MEDERQSIAPYVVWTLVVAIPVAGILVGAAQTKPSGPCEGIGFGCSLSGSAMAGFIAVLVVPVAIVVLVVGYGAIALIRSRRRR